MRTIADAEAILKGRDTRKLGNNTYLERRGDGIAIRLHRTDVVTFNADGSVTFDSGGWRTVTTKSRMGMVTGISVYQRDFKWYVIVAKPDADGLRYDWDEPPIEYFDGVTVTAKGEITDRSERV